MDRTQVPLNDFQVRVEQRLNAALGQLGSQIESRNVGWEAAASPSQPREAIVHLRVQELDVRIRENSVSFTLSGKGDYYEMADYRDPDALSDAFLTALTKRWSEKANMR